MSTQTARKRKSIRDIVSRKGQEPLVCLTAYDAIMGRLADPHADLILVGDSLGMVVYGFDSTLPVTLDMMRQHGRAVVNATSQALVAIDMPFGSYQESPAQAFASAARLMADTGCQAVKLEGGAEMAQTISFLTQRGIPVIAHIGLQPQSVHSVGGYRVMGRDDASKARIMDDAKAVSAAGAFAIVLECMDEELAAAISRTLEIPTIGIGASAACDGQILVTEDMLGLTAGPVPKFVKPYATLSQDVSQAIESYAAEVKGRAFPSENFLYFSDKK